METEITEQIVGAMIEKKVTYRELASALGISRPTIWRKMNRPEMWRVGELQKVAALLHIDFVIAP